MTAIVGTPVTTVIPLANADGSPNDPYKVVLSSVSPLGQATPYTVGVAASATRSASGSYQLVWTPTAPGNWIVILDGYDSGGNQVIAASSATVTVAYRRGGTPAQIQAQSIVEAYIGPFALTTETIRLYSGPDGILILPRTPVVSVTSVVASTDFYEDTTPSSPVVPTPTPDSNGVLADVGILAYTFHDVTYSWGYTAATLPEVIRTVLTAVAARIAANPDGVSSEQIGAGYRVTYPTVSPAWLTKDEKDALSQFRRYKTGTLITSTPIGAVE